MKLNIIIDSRRAEKYEPLVAELNSQGITDYELWPCMILPEVIESINASHKMIVRWAKDNGLDEVVIGEDDLMFTTLGAWRYFLSKKPRFFDLYLGGCYSQVKHGWDEAPYSYTLEPVGFHLYIIHSRYYDAFLGTDSHLHIDTAQKSHAIKVCYPFAALQRPGFSSNNKCDQDYNSILKPEDIYQG